MARSKVQTTAIANYDEELAQQAQAATAMAESSGGGGGKFFTLRAGVIAWDDAPLPGNQMAVIIIAGRLENVYYEEKFDPDNPSPPTCFAFGKDAADMEPHDMVDTPPFERQHAQCKGCPQNEWGSADTGRGKACSNRRRLALLPAGAYVPLGKGKGYDLELHDDEAYFASAEPGFLKVPVMSGKGYDTFVKNVAEQFQRPPHAVIARIWSEPDPKSQFRLHFEVLDKVPSHLLPVILRRHKEIDAEIEFPYTPRSEDEPAPKTNAKLGRKPAARGRK